MNGQRLATALTLCVLGSPVLGACGQSTAPAVNPLSGAYTITSYSDDQNGGASSATGSLTLTATTYSFSITAAIYFNLPYDDNGTYTTTDGGNVTLHSQAGHGDCAGIYAFRDHAGVGADSLTIDCYISTQHIVSGWVK